MHPYAVCSYVQGLYIAFQSLFNGNEMKCFCASSYIVYKSVISCHSICTSGDPNWGPEPQVGKHLFREHLIHRNSQYRMFLKLQDRASNLFLKNTISRSITATASTEKPGSHFREIFGASAFFVVFSLPVMQKICNIKDKYIVINFIIFIFVYFC